MKLFTDIFPPKLGSRFNRSAVSLSLAACFLGGSVFGEAPSDEDSPSSLWMWDPERAAELRQKALADDPSVRSAVEQIRRYADEALDEGPFTVTDKTFLPPSGDPNDYSTIGRYWWPNPDTEDGLPWIRIDGETNPMYFDGEIGDTHRALAMCRAVMTLARAYHVTDHEPYAEHAAKLLRVWFIDPDTRMNPHAEYAARFPGRWDGSPLGIHGARHFTDLVDPVNLIERSPAWSAEDHEAIKNWFNDYLEWLMTSEKGQTEAEAINNHGTGWDWIAANMAAFVGKEDLAREILEKVKPRRIDTQIEPDGSMPHELRRAQPWRYTGYALEFFFKLGVLADRLDVDLWHYVSPDGRGIRPALDYLIEQIRPDGKLDPDLLQEVGVGRIGPQLAIAATVYDEPFYRELIEEIGYNNSLRIHTWAPNPHLTTGVADH